MWAMALSDISTIILLHPHLIEVEALLQKFLKVEYECNLDVGFPATLCLLWSAGFFFFCGVSVSLIIMAICYFFATSI